MLNEKFMIESAEVIKNSINSTYFDLKCNRNKAMVSNRMVAVKNIKMSFSP